MVSGARIRSATVVRGPSYSESTGVVMRSPQ
jgi:hypothetical protein